ncbi:MAG: hypothetical protein WCD38_11795 [Candidatus Tumulicola sp.]
MTWDSLISAWVNPNEDLKPSPNDIEGIAAMQLGFRVEDMVLDALERGLPWIGDDDWLINRNVHAALILTEEGLQGRLFFGDDATGQMLEFAEHHEGVAVGHIDAIVHDVLWKQAIVLDCKSTVWSDSYASGERVWTQKYGPKDSHCLQVATYAMIVALQHAGCDVRAGLLELDLGGKKTRWSEVEWSAVEDTIRQRMVDVLERTDPANDAPEAKPNPWTRKANGQSWACGSPGKRAYCNYLSCPSHVANKVTMSKSA